LSFNNLIEIENVLDSVAMMKKLKMLSLFGNPICLLANYKTAILHEFGLKLHYFDGVKVFSEQSEKEYTGFFGFNNNSNNTNAS
jgi:hypothetical protein